MLESTGRSATHIASHDSFIAGAGKVGQVSLGRRVSTIAVALQGYRGTGKYLFAVYRRILH